MKLSRKQKLLLKKKRIKETKRYKKKMSKVTKHISFYRNNPTFFVEEYLGVKLKCYQKLLLKLRRNKDKL